MRKYFSTVILVLTLVAGTVLRFSENLFHRDYWYDEAFTGILLKQPWSVMNKMIFADVHPPLYYWLAKPWAMLFDYSPGGIRSFSLLMGVLSIISIYWIGRKIFDQRVGVIAAILTAFSPFAIEYSQEARMYSLFGFLMVWAFYFFYQALQTNQTKNWLLWGLFGGLAFYTHYLSLFFFVMFYVAYVCYRYLQNKETTEENKKSFWKLFLGETQFWLGTGVIILFFASWIKIFIKHISKGNLGWIDPAQLSDIPKTLQIFFFGHPAGTGGVPWSNAFRYIFDGTSVGLLIFTVMVALLVLAWVKNIKKKELMVLCVLSFGTMLFLIIASQFNIKLYVARYFMPAALFVYLLLAALVEEVLANRWAWLVMLGFYALLLLMLKPLTFNSDWDAIYSAKDDLLKNQELILTSNAFDYSTARFYFGQDKVRYYNKNNPTEDFSGWVVVGNDNRLTDAAQVMQDRSKYLVVGSDCNWPGLDMLQTWRLDNLSLCLIKKPQEN